MVSLEPEQLAYLQGENRLARLASADRHGKPHVVPVGMWHYNSEFGTVDVSGHQLSSTKKYRNVQVNPHAALVVDDVASVDPWHPRAVMVQGPAEVIPPDADEEAVIRITPETIVSWGV